MILDSIDVKILKAVQRNCRIGANDLGEQVGLSASAAQRRLNVLRSSGVITHEVAIVSPDKVGRPLLFITEVTLVGEKAQGLREFLNMLLANDAVTQVYYVTGGVDYIVHYLAKNMNEYDEFTQEAFFDNKFVSDFRTKVVMRVMKPGLEIPVK